MGELEGETQMGSKVQRGMGDLKVLASYIILLLYKTLPWVQEPLDTLNSSPMLIDGFVKINMLMSRWSGELFNPRNSGRLM